LDGGFVAKKWEPTNDQVIELQRAQKARLAQVPMVVFSEPQDEPTQLPPADLDPEPAADPGTPTPPTKLPPGTSWHKSWEEFFRNRDITSRNCLEHATEQQKASWESLSQHARKFQQPGKNGARVYVWETCNSGGFYRILQTRFEVARDWDSYFEEALVFSPRHNARDHCPFSWGPAVEDGPPEDLDDEDNHRIVDSWYAEPEASATVSGGDPEPLEYLYFGYGFLSIEPTTPLGATLPLDRSAAYRIVGLGAHNSQRQPEHLNSFITSIIQEQLPTGHCDLCPTSPPNETFPGKALIHDAVFRSNFPDLANGAVFILENSFNESPLLAVHEPLSILQMVRAGTLLQLRTALQYLVTNGSRFTALYPEARSSSCQQFNLLPNPMRGVGWKPDSEDFRAYRSRLATFLLERPYVAAAAFSRGGIAGRIALEVLGIEKAMDILLNTVPDQRCSVNTSRGVYWHHEIGEREWFYLVGGYEVLTGVWISLLNWTALTPKQERANRWRNFRGGPRLPPGREAAFTSGIGRLCASGGFKTV